MSSFSLLYGVNGLFLGHSLVFFACLFVLAKLVHGDYLIYKVDYNINTTLYDYSNYKTV